MFLHFVSVTRVSSHPFHALKFVLIPFGAQDGWLESSQEWQNISDCAESLHDPGCLTENEEDTNAAESTPDNHASPHWHAPSTDHAEAAPGLLHDAWWPQLTPLAGMEEPIAQDATRAANAGDLIDRALFHAEAAAACRRGSPPPPALPDHLLWDAVAEDTVTGAGLQHSCAFGLGFARIPDARRGAADVLGHRLAGRIPLP